VRSAYPGLRRRAIGHDTQSRLSFTPGPSQP
jgi:hypothetical protein